MKFSKLETKAGKGLAIWYDNLEEVYNVPDEAETLVCQYDDRLCKEGKSDTKDTWRFGKEWAEKPQDNLRWMREGFLDEKMIDYRNKSKDYVDPSAGTFIGQQNRRRKRKNEYDGDFNFDAIMSGDPQIYTRVNKVNTKARAKRVLINTTVSAHTETKDYVNAMVKAMNFVNYLTRKGYLTEVYACWLSAGGWTKTLYSDAIMGIRLKDGNMPFDRQRLYTICYPSFFRHSLFRAMGVGAQAQRDFFDQKNCVPDYGLGHVINNKSNTDRLKAYTKEISKQMFGGDDSVVYLDLHTDYADKEELEKGIG